MRFALFLLTSLGLFAQCDDVAVPAKKAKKLSDVVFQGTVEGFKSSGAGRIVVFRVSRVWKGPVRQTFEMPAIETDGGMCTAFWRGLLVPGNEMVVYAAKYPWARDVTYLPMRSKSTLVSRATDIGQLGLGHAPK